MRIVALQRDFSRKVSQIGFFGAVGHAFKHLVARRTLIEDGFDALHGTDTASIVSVGGLGLSHEQSLRANRYETSPAANLASFFDAIGIDHARFTFVDIGSGKGRALMEASRFPFLEIVGVEISEKLCRIAQQNLRVFPIPPGRRVRVVCSDATKCELPIGPMIVYLYNPMPREPMIELVKHLEKFDVRFVIYQNPAERDVWDSCTRFRHLRSIGNAEIYRSLA